MMRLDMQGGRIFSIRAPGASVVELTVDFGGGLVRTLAMHRLDDEWSVRLHPGLPFRRFRYRVDGRIVCETGSEDGDALDSWCEIRPAA